MSQDSDGAVFLATDAQTGREVLLQRFFPFGAGEGGLEGDELNAYAQGILRMKQLADPSLRCVIEGGCDPVDGMPFLVTESPSSTTLREFCSNGALNAAQGRLLVESALGLMLGLEQVFGQVADWLSLRADDIEVIGDAEQFRFGVDPMRWLGLYSGPSGVKELAVLAEDAMGWTGRVLTGSTAGLLSGWLTAAKSRDLSPSQAWEVLHGAAVPQRTLAKVAVAPTFSTSAPLAQSVTLASAKSGGSTGWVIAGALLVVGGLAVGGVIFLNSGKKPPVVAAVPVTPTTIPAAPARTSAKATTSVDSAKAPVVTEQAPLSMSQEDKMRADIERRALELQAQASATTTKPNPPAAVAGPKSPKKETYAPGEVILMREQKGEQITVVARVLKVKLSSTGKSLYVEFDGGAPERILGRYLTNLGVDGMSVSELGSLEGKWVRATGTVGTEVGTNRVVLDLRSPTQLVEQPAPQ